MSTETTVNMETEIIVFNVTDAAIQELKDKYHSLNINGIDDKDGYNAVHEARMDIKTKRTEVEKRRKKYLEGALAYQKRVNGEAKRITELLETIEATLLDKETAIDAEKDRIKAEKERASQAILEARVRELTTFGYVVPSGLIIKDLTEDEFRLILEGAKAKFEVEQARVAEQQRVEAEQRAKKEAQEKEERERLQRVAQEQEAERKRLDALRAEQEARDQAARREIEAERNRLRAEQEAIDRQKREADERAREEIKAKKEAEEKKEREAAELKRQEELRPDRETLLSIAIDVESLIKPTFKTDAARILFERAQNNFCTHLRNGAETL